MNGEEHDSVVRKEGVVGGEVAPGATPKRAERSGPVTAEADLRVGGAATGGGHPPAPDLAENAPRPTDLDPQQLGFTPRRPVPWLNPVLLAGTAVRVVLAGLFGAYLDKRELQGSLAADVFDERPADSDELWVDYVADLGDGFNPTYTIAYLLAQPELTIDDLTLPRGRILIMGGDEVYPTPSGKQYEDRFKGPYRAAMPEPPPDVPRPTLYALPGNHDWYDGLTAFVRLFARVDDARIGGWRTRQRRSYFAVRLPNRWWLLALDAQFGAYIDDPQLTYFRAVADELGPDDKVIVCPPAPTWVESFAAPHAYDTLDYFLRKVVIPTGAQVRVMISGDLHHYARYSGPGRELITCGGGGAYLYATHRLREQIDVPPPETLVRNASPPRRYRLAATFPSKQSSRSFAAGVFGRLPFHNPGFVTLVGVLHVLLMLSMANALPRFGGTARQLVTIPLGMMVVVFLASTIAFAMPETGGARSFRHWALGFVHGAAHIALAYLGAVVWLRLPLVDLPFPLPLLAAFVVYVPIVGLLGSWVVGAYLLVASMFDINLNELFAGQAIIDAKSFLRMHFGADGSLTIYPIAVNKVNRRWAANPDAEPHRPWIEPAEPIRYRLVEPPVRIT